MICPTFTPLVNLLEKKFKNSHCRTSEEKIPEFTYSQTPPTDSSDKLTPTGTTGGGRDLWGGMAQPSHQRHFKNSKLPRFEKTSEDTKRKPELGLGEKRPLSSLWNFSVLSFLFPIFAKENLSHSTRQLFFWCRTTNVTAFSIHLLSEL